METAERTATCYNIVAEYTDIKIKVPTRSLHWTCGLLKNGEASFPFGKKEFGINKCNLDQALKYKTKADEKIFFQIGMPIENGVILNRFFYGLEAGDFGKTINAEVSIIDKVVTKGTFTELNYTKSSGISRSTNELKIGSPLPATNTHSIKGTDKTISIVAIPIKELV